MRPRVAQKAQAAADSGWCQPGSSGLPGAAHGCTVHACVRGKAKKILPATWLKKKKTQPAIMFYQRILGCLQAPQLVRVVPVGSQSRYIRALADTGRGQRVVFVSQKC